MVGFFNIFSVKGMALFMALGISLFSGSDGGRVSTYFMGQSSAGEDTVDVTKLSASEIRSKMNSLAGSWEGKKNNIQKMLSTARSKKNIMRINCIEPKVKSVTFWIGEGRQAQAEIKTSNKERLGLLYQKIAVINNNIEDQVLKASRCIGDEKFSSGEGFELKASHPDEILFDPDRPVLNNGNFMETYNTTETMNPDWSVDLTWNAATPYY